MSFTIGVRTLVSFAAGIAAAVVVLVVFQAVTADASPGDADATFVPTTACRLFDTRQAPDRVGPFDAFGAGDTKTVQAHGSNGECVIPADAVGLSLNVTAVGASAPTFLTIWPDGPRPLASSLNPTPGQPPTPNAVATNLSDAGSFEVFNLAGSVDVLVDVNGYYTKASLQDLDGRVAAFETAGVPADVLARLEALEADNTALKADVAALEAKTAAMSIEDSGGTVRFTGVDVQIVDGTNTTQCSVTGFEDCIGTGNLIIGYNEDTDNDEVRSGSHNIVTGTDNDYTSYSGIAAGRFNTITGQYATITGGTFQRASGLYSSVSGGSGNTASAIYSSVSGGRDNTASSNYTSVSGGRDNTASLNYSSVSGGWGNTASGTYSSASGGRDNTVNSNYASVSGGTGNTASGLYSSVSGGIGNTASGLYSSVSGGNSNDASGDRSSVLGGVNNEVSGNNDTVIGGDDLVCGDSSEGACGEYENTAAEWRPSD